MRRGDEQRRRLAEGIERFNSRRFWEAHESWEAIWLQSVEPEKTFLQGLIQLTAACHHFRRGTLSGGVRLFDAAVEKLGDYPEGFMGVSRAGALRLAHSLRDHAATLVSEGRQEAKLPAKMFDGLRLEASPRMD